MSASAFSLTAVIPTQGFDVTEGNSVIGGLKSPRTRHFFCPSCLTWLCTKVPQMELLVNVRSSIFGDHSWVEPFIETMVSNRQDWVKLTSRHRFSTFPKSDEYETLMKESSLARDIRQ